MAESFKTYSQQIESLKAKGMIIKDETYTLRILARESYYNLINGYQELFLSPLAEHNNTGTFIKGTNFDEIHALYLLDRELRNLLLEYFLKFETTMKSILTDRFCANYIAEHAYLDIKNYEKKSESSRDVLALISNLFKIIQKEEKKHGAIRYSLNNHGYVPFWVLTNFMTLGNVQRMYDCLQPTLKNEIAKYFALEYKREYQKQHLMSSDALISILKSVNFFRNVCAHEERLYNYRIYKKPETKHISKNLGIQNNFINKGDLFMVVASLKLVTSKNDYDILKGKLRCLFDKYELKFSTVKFNTIMSIMGFPSNWKEII